MIKRSLCLLVSLAIIITSTTTINFISSAAATCVFPEKFLIKQDMDSFTNPEVAVGSSGKWKTASTNNFAFSIGTGSNAYSGKGKSVAVSYNKFNYFNGAQNVYYMATFSNTDEKGNKLGKDSRFGFWIKSDQDMQIKIKLNDTTTNPAIDKQIQSDWKSISAGENIVMYDWSELKPLDENYEQVLDYIYTMTIYFKPTDAAKCVAKGKLYIDSVGFEDIRSDKRTDTPALHSNKYISCQSMDAFEDPTQEPNADARYWKTSYSSNFSFSTGTLNDAYGYSGKSVSINYNKLTKYTGIQHFDYLAFLYNKDKKGVELKKESQFSLWIKSTQAVKLKIVTNDSDQSGGSSNRIETDYISIPKGESIVDISWDMFTPLNSQTYNEKLSYLYGLYFYIQKDSEYSKDDGTIWIDEIGFNDLRKDDTVTNKHTDDFAVKQDLELFEDLTVNPGNAGKWINTAYSNKFSFSIGKDENAYDGKGKSAAVSYKSLSTLHNGAYFLYNAHFKNTNKNDEELLENGIFSFWIKTDQSIKLKISANDSYDAGKNKDQVIVSDWIDVPKGESIVKFALKDMAPLNPENYVKSLEFLYGATFYIGKTDSSVEFEDGVIYLDQFGFYGDPAESNPGSDEPCEKVYHSSDFSLKQDLEAFKDLTEKTGNSGKWINTSYSNRFTLSIANNDNAYAGIGQSAKISYKNLSTLNKGPYLTYNAYFYNCDSNYSRLGEKGIFSFWIKSDQDMKIRVTVNDSYDAGKNSNQKITSKWVKISKGENIVKFPVSEFTPNNPEVYVKKLDYFYGLTFNFSAIEGKAVTENGSVYVDQFGFYGKGESIELSKTFSSEFSAKLDMEAFTDDLTVSKGDSGNWKNNAYAKFFNLSIGTNENAYGGKGKSAGITYSKMSSYGEGCYVLYKAYLHNRNNQNLLMDDNSSISFWVKTDQTIKIRLACDDSYDLGKNQNQRITSSWYIIPQGSGVVTIPLKEFTALNPKEYNKTFKYFYTLMFYIAAADSSNCKDTGTLYIDEIGINCTGNVTENSTSFDNSYIWFGFDSYKNDDELKSFWSVRWPGINNAGGTISLDSSKENVYNSTGKSLKFAYNNKACDNGIASVCYANKLYCYGDGLVLFIKSNENTRIKIVGLDNTIKSVYAPTVEVFRGNNIVYVPWSNFIYMSSDLSGQVPDMTRISQLQVRPCGVAAGTIWIDEIGFRNISSSKSDNSYELLFPKNTFNGWYEGNDYEGENFDSYPADDDEQFCIDWYYNYQNYDSWISLEKSGTNSILKFDYDYKSNISADLVCNKKFSNVDALGGIKFWAKTSDERNFMLKICIDNKYYEVALKGSTAGKTYKIPFSALHVMNKVNEKYVCTQPITYDVSMIRFMFNGEISDEKHTNYLKENPIGGIWATGRLKNLSEYLNFNNGDSEDSILELKSFVDLLNKNSKIPLLVGGDSEKGNFMGTCSIPGPDAVVATNDRLIAYKYGKCVAEELKNGGLNWRWSPIADLAHHDSSICVNRVCSDDPEKVVWACKEMVRGMQESGVAATVKHFPGQDINETRDSHFMSSVNYASVEDWKKNQGRVYKEIIDDGVYSVMIGHHAFPAFDDSFINGKRCPATFSKKIITDLLKGEMKFDGVVITDDLGMRSAFSIFGREKMKEAYVALVNAGNDIILGTNIGVEHEDFIGAVENAVNSGIVSEERVNDACRRIFGMKEKLGLFDNKTFVCNVVDSFNNTSKMNKELSEKSLTLLSNKSKLIPVSENIKSVAIIAITHTEEFVGKLSFMVKCFEKRGIKADVFQSVYGICGGIKAASQKYDLIIYANFVSAHMPMGRCSFFGNVAQQFFNILSYGEDKSVVVSFGSPFLRKEYYEEAPTYINAYWYNDEMQEAFVKGLFGEIPFTGTSPFEL